MVSSRIPWVSLRNSYCASSLGRSCLNKIGSTICRTWVERGLMRESPKGKSEWDQSKRPLILRAKQSLQRTELEAIYTATLSPTHSSQPIFSKRILYLIRGYLFASHCTTTTTTTTILSPYSNTGRDRNPQLREVEGEEKGSLKTRREDQLCQQHFSLSLSSYSILFLYH